MIKGKGFFIWKSSYCDSGNITKTIDRLKTMGVSWVALKIGDGASTTYQSYPDMASAIVSFRTAGLSVWAWHYIYGGIWIDKSGTIHTDMPTPEQEAKFAVETIKKYGFDGYIIDAEREYKVASPVPRAQRFSNALKNIGVPVALCSYRYPSYHPEFPWAEFLQISTIHMPQVYWGNYANAPKKELEKSYAELKALKNIPFIPVGRAYIGDAHPKPTAGEVTQFMETARALGMEACSFWAYDFICQHTTGPELEKAITAYSWPGQQTTPTDPILPIQGENYMEKARGLFVNGSTLVKSAALKERDFLIAKHGAEFHENVQIAASLGKPCLLFYEANPELMVNAGYSLGSIPDDKNTDLQNIIADVMVGGTNGTKRAIHGILIGASTWKEADGGTLAVNWLVGVAKNLIEKSFKYLKLPIYLFMDYIVPEKYGTSERETIFSMIRSQGDISTYDDTSPLDAAGMPIARPKLPYDDSSVAPWAFWMYKPTVNGIETVFSKDKISLYASLNFTPSFGNTPTPDPIVPNPVDPGEPGQELPESNTGYDRLIYLELKRLNDWIQR